MLKKSLQYFIFLFAFSFLFVLGSKASHIAGIDMYYTYVGTNQIKITVNLYRDKTPGNLPLPGSIDVLCSSASCGIDLNIVGIDMSIGSGGDVAVNDCFTVTTGFDYEWGVYDTIITLPTQCSDWLLEFEDCCRNSTIDNLSTQNSLYCSFSYNNLVAPINSAPTFKYAPVSSLCVGRKYNFDQGAFDLDGDSLVYSLVPAEDTGPTNYTYVAPYSASNPFPSSIGVTINPTTGVVTFIPTAIGVFVICVLVEEYRNGIFIGSIKRDMQMFFGNNCRNDQPEFAGTSTTTVGSFYYVDCGETSITVKLSSKIQCASVCADGSEFSLYNPFRRKIATSSTTLLNCVDGFADSMLVTFSEPFASTVYYSLEVDAGTDGNFFLSKCGNETGKLYITIEAKMGTWQTSVVSSPICDKGSDGSVKVVGTSQGNYTYTWNTTPPTIASSLSNLKAGKYKVEINQDGCTAEDSVTIYQPSIINGYFPRADTVFCEKYTGKLVLKPSGGTGGYQYKWYTLNGTAKTYITTNSTELPYLINDTTLQNIKPNTYYVDITDNNGCTKSFSRFIGDRPSPIADFEWSNGNDSVYVKDYFEITDYSKNREGTIKSWQWTVNPNNHTYTTPIVLDTYADSALYSATLVITNSFGCSDTITKTQQFYNRRVVKIPEVPKVIHDILFPNIFTPNGDAQNDKFSFKYLEDYPESKLLIFNRWGFKVFENTDYKNDWQGEGMANGTYYYILSLKEGKNYEGHVTLAR